MFLFHIQESHIYFEKLSNLKNDKGKKQISIPLSAANNHMMPAFKSDKKTALSTIKCTSHM